MKQGSAYPVSVHAGNSYHCSFPQELTHSLLLLLIIQIVESENFLSSDISLIADEL